MKVSEIKDPYARILGYGVSGAGKTTFISTMPGPIYILNFEPGNLVPLMTRGVDAEYDDYTTFSLVDKKLLDLVSRCPYKTVVVDGMGSLYKLCLDSLTNGKQPTQADWGAAHERFKNVIRKLRTLPCHVYVTFHSQMEKNEVSGEITGRILIPGKSLPDEIPAMFNMFLRFDAQAIKGQLPKRVVHTTPTSIWPAGEKFGALAPEEVPDFAQMWAKVQAKLQPAVLIKEVA